MVVAWPQAFRLPSADSLPLGSFWGITFPTPEALLAGLSLKALCLPSPTWIHTQDRPGIGFQSCIEHGRPGMATLVSLSFLLLRGVPRTLMLSAQERTGSSTPPYLESSHLALDGCWA